MRQPLLEIVVADTENTFDELFRQASLIATFADDVAESHYEKLDDSLARAIDAIGKRLFRPGFVKKHLHVNWDWWPNHTRYVDASLEAFTQKYFDELRGVLTGVYEQWRIQVTIYEDPMKGETCIGSIAIWADHVLVERRLHEALASRNIDLGCDKTRFVRR